MTRSAAGSCSRVRGTPATKSWSSVRPRSTSGSKSGRNPARTASVIAHPALGLAPRDMIGHRLGPRGVERRGRVGGLDDAGEAVGDVFDFDIKGRGVEEIKPAAG